MDSFVFSPRLRCGVCPDGFYVEYFFRCAEADGAICCMQHPAVVVWACMRNTAVCRIQQIAVN